MNILYNGRPHIEHNKFQKIRIHFRWKKSLFFMVWVILPWNEWVSLVCCTLHTAQWGDTLCEVAFIFMLKISGQKQDFCFRNILIPFFTDASPYHLWRISTQQWQYGLSVFKQKRDGFVFHGYHLSQFYDVVESFIGHVRPPK